MTGSVYITQDRIASLHRPLDGTAVRCTCCGYARKLAELHGTTLEIAGGRVGNKHYTRVTIQELLQHMAGTRGRDGVLRFVDELYN